MSIENTDTRPEAESRENSVDATRGEPLAVRAQQRKAELETALSRLQPADQRQRDDIELALAAVAGLLTGDVTRLAASTAVDHNRWLERTKHLAETTPTIHSAD